MRSNFAMATLPRWSLRMDQAGYVAWAGFLVFFLPFDIELYVLLREEKDYGYVGGD
jgi:hypothetical protein